LYQFSGANGRANTAVQAQLGVEGGGASVDAYYAKKDDAIATAPLSAAQVSGLPALCSTSVAPPANPNGALCFSPSNSLAATISDNETFGVMGSYSFGAPKVFAGYEHMEFANPKTPLLQGSLTIGGYVLAAVNNTAYVNHKTLQVFWAGVKFAATPQVDLTASYVGYKQSSFAAGAKAGCSDTSNGACSGTLSSVGLLVDYRFAKRFDAYLGTLWSGVDGGLANGYLNKGTLSTTSGIRFRF
jgi:predicted porin